MLLVDEIQLPLSTEFLREFQLCLLRRAPPPLLPASIDLKGGGLSAASIRSVIVMQIKTAHGRGLDNVLGGFTSPALHPDCTS